MISQAGMMNSEESSTTCERLQVQSKVRLDKVNKLDTSCVSTRKSESHQEPVSRGICSLRST